MRERRARKNAGAIIVVLGAIRAEHVVIGAMLVIMLEEIVRFRYPFDELAPLELVQHMTDPARVLGMRGQQEQDVMQQHVGCKDSTNQQNGQADYRDDLQLGPPERIVLS